MEGQPLATVVDYVRAHTRPDDWVAVFPEERLVNFLAERRHPTRDSGTGPGWLATKEDEEACVAELEARRPALVVLTDRRWPEFGAEDLGSYNPTLRAWIDREYEPVLTTAPNIVRYTIYAPRGKRLAVFGKDRRGRPYDARAGRSTFPRMLWYASHGVQHWGHW